MEEDDAKKIDIKKQYSGTIYQIKVLLLLLCRGKKVESYEDFYLRTEVKDAEKFDDALFYYKKSGEKNYNVRYCQIKNSESETAELRYSDFVSDYDKAVANIKKYFISYRKIKMTAIKEILDDFVLCTSYKLLLELKKNDNATADEILKFIEDNTPDKLFGHPSDQWKKYKISQISEELRSSLMKTTDLDLLAEALTECIIKNKNSSAVTIDFKNFWLYLYKSALIKENVFVQESTTIKKLVGKKSKDFIFSTTFLENNSLSKECENFRNIFLSYCGTKFMNLILRDKNFSADESFMSLLNTEIKSQNMEEEKESFLSTQQLKEIEQLAKHLSESLFAEQLLTSEIILAHQNEGEGKKLGKSTFYEKSEMDDPNISMFSFLKKIFKSVGVGAVKFTGNFVKNEKLTEDVKQFREYFLKYYAVLKLKEMKFKLVQNECHAEFEIGKQLVNEVNIEAEMEEFFRKFSIQTLPHHDELISAIKEEIVEEFDLLDDKWVANSLFEKVEEWFKKAEEHPFNKSQILKYYEEIKKDIALQMMEGNFYIQMLKSYHLKFGTIPDTWKIFLNPLDQECMKKQSNQLLILSSEEPIGSSLDIFFLANSYSNQTRKCHANNRLF